MDRVVNYAVNMTERGYACYPVNVSLSDDGDKILSFKDGKWAAGEYPTNPDEIAEHWQGFAGIAINTGKSGLVVVDIDTKGDKDGHAALVDGGIVLPATPFKVRTWSGGEHWFYREGETPIPSSSDQLARGVDIRARGGIVIAPPTVVRGHEYAFEGKPVSVSALPEFPAELAEKLVKAKAKVHTTDTRPVLTPDQRQRMNGKLDRILRDLSNMADGTRNATMRLRMIRLFGIAMSLGEDLNAVAELAREAYFESGGTAEHELESFIEWAMEHANYELPEEETDEEFEAEVAARIRRAKVEEAAKARLSPIQVKTISDDDILEFDPDSDEGDWWIPEVLPRDETVILFGPPNAGKSFAAVDLAMGIATGRGVWGFGDVPRGKVLYLAGEGTRRLTTRRKAWEVFHEITAGRDKIQFRKMRLLLGSDESVASHRQLINDHEVDLIIVDTMLRAAEGMALENPGEASRTIAQLDRLREDRPGATVVVLHHPPELSQDKPSGSYPLRGNVDTIFQLKNEGGIRTLRTVKSREGNDSWSSSYELRDIRVPGTRNGSAVFVPATYGWDNP